jgi:hypothetical protein
MVYKGDSRNEQESLEGIETTTARQPHPVLAKSRNEQESLEGIETNSFGSSHFKHIG